MANSARNRFSRVSRISAVDDDATSTSDVTWFWRFFTGAALTNRSPTVAERCLPSLSTSRASARATRATSGSGRASV